MYKGYWIEVDEDESGWWWTIYDDDGPVKDIECPDALVDQYAAVEDAENEIDHMLLLSKGAT